MYQFPYERLNVWKESMLLIKEVYQAIIKFPKSEDYALKSQLKRAVVSVTSNIAEGSARLSPKQQAYFFQMAYGSLIEVNCQLQIAVSLGYLEEESYKSLREHIRQISSQLSALRNRQFK
ncbi:four helix bundle protein [Algivirga pacifica]|uniref:Four helix bundle protein n=1 Tax=Algivirga pacifica TaxID=1162670 RepID=A0ABP9DB75_9BACT